MKDELLNELKKQDEELKKIFARREEIRKIAEKANFYDELWEDLYRDGEVHYTF